EDRSWAIGHRASRRANPPKHRRRQTQNAPPGERPGGAYQRVGGMSRPGPGKRERPGRRGVSRVASVHAVPPAGGAVSGAAGFGAAFLGAADPVEAARAFFGAVSFVALFALPAFGFAAGASFAFALVELAVFFTAMVFGPFAKKETLMTGRRASRRSARD